MIMLTIFSKQPKVTKVVSTKTHCVSVFSKRNLFIYKSVHLNNIERVMTEWFGRRISESSLFIFFPKR